MPPRAPTPAPATLTLHPGVAPSTDAGGNRKLPPIGPWLQARIDAHFKSVGVPVHIKYIGALQRRKRERERRTAERARYGVRVGALAGRGREVMYVYMCVAMP